MFQLKFFLQKNGIAFKYCINLVEAIIRHHNLHLRERTLSMQGGRGGEGFINFLKNNS